MAYTPIKLSDWLTNNPSYAKYTGTLAGAPLIYQAAATEPSLEPTAWNVFDYVSGTPDLSQAPSEADISPTGVTIRRVIPTVPDAPSATDLSVFLGQDTDATIEALEGIGEAYQTAIAAGQKFYLAYFLGAGKKSQVFSGAVVWSGTLDEVEFPDPLSSTLTITPNLGDYNKWQTIGAVSG